MLKNANFLCEIGTEEIPAGYIPPAIESIKKILKHKLIESRIDFTDISVFATPRRITFMASGMSDSQNSEEIEIKGPSVKVAYDSNGEPTKALLGFIKGNKIKDKDIEKRDTGKGEYLFARKKLESKSTTEIIPDIIESIIRNLTFPKQMRWSDKKLLFPRPIAYMLILFNDSVVKFEIEGIKSSDLTRGHYIQHDKMIRIKKIDEYEKKLKENDVIIDQDERKKTISEKLIKTAGEAGGELIEDEELLDTVTFLVENPEIAVCEFNSDFLKIPDIVLIAEMKEHQKYFSIKDKKGKLINKFLVTSNNPITENVKVGNERVITARFNDASFFYNEDKKVKLIDRLDSLKNVLFHKELGSIYDKVQRMEFISNLLCEKLGLDKELREKTARAIKLSKTDLVTCMVGEFPSLQGKIGRIYAGEEGEDKRIADSIDFHYRPRFQGDELPVDIISIIVSLSEKIDNILGSFSVGNIPKGSQDPYALRRQANAIVETVLRNNINIQFNEIFSNASVNYKDSSSQTSKIIEFITARVKTIFLEKGLRFDEVDACLSGGFTDYLELYKRAKSINEFRENEKFSELLLSFKRMNNIIAAFRNKNRDYVLKFDESYFECDEEKELYNFFESKSSEIEKLISSSEYVDLFKLIIKGKGHIDKFFDKVLVMDERINIRDNRLHLLENILARFANLIDFSKISDK